LDKLIVNTKRLFEQKGMAGFIALLLRLVDERICLALLYEKPLWRPISSHDSPLQQPKGATSMIDRMMREIGRRLKKIAFGWSEKRAAKMARIIIKRITSGSKWDEYWRRQLRIEGNASLIYRGVKAQ